MKMSRKQWMMGAAGAALVVVVLIAGLGACHRCMGPDGFHSRFGKHHGPERILKEMDRRVADLELRDSQQAVYDRIRSGIAKDLRRFGEERKAFRKSLAREIERQDPDANAIAARVRKGMDRFRDLMTTHLDRMVELYGVLDEAQKQKVLEHVRERMERCGS